MKFWKSALLYAATVCTLTATSCSDETKEPKLYTTAVTDDGNGTAEANPASAIPGETVTLTATRRELLLPEMDGPQRRYRTGKSDGKPDDVHPAGGRGNIEIRAEFTDLLSLAASEIIAYDAEKAATVTRLSVSGDLTDEVTAAIFDKFQNLLFL